MQVQRITEHLTQVQQDGSLIPVEAQADCLARMSPKQVKDCFTRVLDELDNHRYLRAVYPSFASHSILYIFHGYPMFLQPGAAGCLTY